MVAVAAIYFRTHITLCKVAIVHVGADQSSSDTDREPIIPVASLKKTRASQSASQSVFRLRVNMNTTGFLPDPITQCGSTAKDWIGVASAFGHQEPSIS